MLIQLNIRQKSKPKSSDALVFIRWVNYGCLVQSISTLTNLEDKKITVLVSEIIAVQIYEKTSSSGSSKRPGFSLQN